MRRVANLLRLIIELVFVLLGAFLLRIAVKGFYAPDRRSPLWIAIGAVALLFGVRSLWRASTSSAVGDDRIRGASFALVGLLMLSAAALPFGFVGPLLAVAGCVLILRGVASAVLVLRTH